MADELESIAPVEQAAPAIPEAATAPVDDGPQIIPEPGEDLEQGNEPEPAILDVVEIEWDDGKKYQIPKALEGGLLKNKDYTTKSQENAAMRKALEAEKAANEERLKATESELDDRATLRSISKDLETYAKLSPEDWSAHAAQDPLGTEQHWRRFQLLKDQKTEVQSRLDNAGKTRADAAQQDLAKRVQETADYAAKEIPGYKPELTDTLVKFAIDGGVPEALIKSNWSPTLYKLLYQAHIGSLTLQKQAAAPKLPTTPVQPLETVGGKTTPNARVDLASADMEAYVAARKKGVGGKPLR